MKIVVQGYQIDDVDDDDDYAIGWGMNETVEFFCI